MKTRLIFSAIFLFSLGIQAQHPEREYFENRQVNKLGQAINSEHFDGFPMIMPDGLTLYFSSDRPGGFGDLDIYVCNYDSPNELFLNNGRGQFKESAAAWGLDL